MKPHVNSSYCRISIWILNLVRISCIIQMFYNLTQLIMMLEDRRSKYKITMYEIKIIEASFIPKHLTELIDDIIQLTQILEWGIMILMIQVQNGKTLPKIMFEMSNFKARDDYKTKEKVLIMLYFFLIVMLCIITSIVIIKPLANWTLDHGKIIYTMLIIKNLCLVGLQVSVSAIMVYDLRCYRFQYN